MEKCVRFTPEKQTFCGAAEIVCYVPRTDIQRTLRSPLTLYSGMVSLRLGSGAIASCFRRKLCGVHVVIVRIQRTLSSAMLADIFAAAMPRVRGAQFLYWNSGERRRSLSAGKPAEENLKCFIGQLVFILIAIVAGTCAEFAQRVRNVPKADIRYGLFTAPSRRRAWPKCRRLQPDEASKAARGGRTAGRASVASSTPCPRPAPWSNRAIP